MKALALLPIAGALTLFGSAFSGVWTPPGLEGIPTYKVVLEKTPWGEPEVEEPESGVFPISDAHELLPHGVSGTWGDAPVIELPERLPQTADVANDPWTQAHKAAPRRVVAKTAPKASTTSPWRPSRSYTLAGSSTRYQNASN